MSDCTCVRGDDGQVRVPRSRCPQHGWVDAPTPAPALTDEQIVQRVIERDHRWRFTPIPLGVSMADYVDRRTCGCGEVFADADAHHAHVYRAVVEALYTNAPSMPDDEALEWQTRDIRDWVSFDNPDSPMGPRQFDTWYAAVVARAKREARGGMANDLALLIDQECPHEPDEHAEGTCEVCDYAFAMAQMVRDYAEAANDDHA